MKKISETIVFFGSGPVAAASLAFLADHFSVEAVITKPVPAHHKGSAPVETLAKELGLRLLFTSSKAELDELITKESFQSRLGIIVDFGVIVSAQTINSFALGILNSHFSLLPLLRGADPISFSILEGHSKTGVSLMLIEPALDTGKIIVQKSLNIDSTDTTPSLTNKLINLSNKLMVEYIPLYLNGGVQARSQPHPDRATYSRKLTKEDGLINWTQPAQQIERQIRAFADWPKSHTTLGGKDLVITEAIIADGIGEPGQILSLKSQLVIGTGENSLEILKLKPAGKQEMTAQAFLAGYGKLLDN